MEDNCYRMSRTRKSQSRNLMQFKAELASQGLAVSFLARSGGMHAGFLEQWMCQMIVRVSLVSSRKHESRTSRTASHIQARTCECFRSTDSLHALTSLLKQCADTAEHRQVDLERRRELPYQPNSLCLLSPWNVIAVVVSPHNGLLQPWAHRDTSSTSKFPTGPLVRSTPQHSASSEAAAERARIDGDATRSMF
jgi:hypothetical protein